MKLAVTLLFVLIAAPVRGDDPAQTKARANAPVAEIEAASRATARPGVPSLPTSAAIGGPDFWKNAQSVAVFGLISLAPAALLMLTSFVRIQIVLVLLRQALGSPQVPGNQVLTALALLLTLLVMQPVGVVVHERAIAPLMANEIDVPTAWERGSRPIKRFMVDQIMRTHHERYLTELYDYAVPPSETRVEPTYGDDYPFHVIAPAFLLSELATAMTIGFLIYLPFLVIDLVTAAVLAAMGLFMLPPSLVSLPLKLILFVLADGWMLVASRLLQTFSVRGLGGT